MYINLIREEYLSLENVLITGKNQTSLILLLTHNHAAYSVLAVDKRSSLIYSFADIN